MIRSTSRSGKLRSLANHSGIHRGGPAGQAGTSNVLRWPPGISERRSISMPVATTSSFRTTRTRLLSPREPSGEPFARYWLHNGMVNLGGEKMAKSTGHIIDLEGAIDTYGGPAVRLFYLRAHYRSPLEFSEELLEDAVTSMERLRAFGRRSAHAEAVDGDADHGEALHNSNGRRFPHSRGAGSTLRRGAAREHGARREGRCRGDHGSVSYDGRGFSAWIFLARRWTTSLLRSPRLQIRGG